MCCDELMIPDTEWRHKGEFVVQVLVVVFVESNAIGDHVRARRIGFVANIAQVLGILGVNRFGDKNAGGRPSVMNGDTSEGNGHANDKDGGDGQRQEVPKTWFGGHNFLLVRKELLDLNWSLSNLLGCCRRRFLCFPPVP